MAEGKHVPGLVVVVTKRKLVQPNNLILLLSRINLPNQLLGLLSGFFNNSVEISFIIRVSVLNYEKPLSGWILQKLAKKKKGTKKNIQNCTNNGWKI